VSDFDLESARLIRVQQDLDALLPGEDPTVRAEIPGWLSAGARQGLDLMPAFRRTLHAFQKPSSACRTAERLFHRRTGFVALDRLLARLHTNKSELLLTLDRRKVSAGTRSSNGRDSRDAFLGLARTRHKLGIPFWDYLGSRLKVTYHPTINALDQYIRQRTRYA